MIGWERRGVINIMDADDGRDGKDDYLTWTDHRTDQTRIEEGGVTG